MKFRIKDLENYLTKKLDWKNIAELLTNKAFEASYENGVLEVDILPNRFSDAGSLIGISKEIAYLTKNKVKLPKIKIKESKNKLENFVKVINKTDKAPFYLGRVILNVKNQKSPDWLKEFVKFYDLNSVNLLVDLANFVMFEYNAPIHIFDLDKIKGKTIFVRESKKGERFVSLEEKEYVLDEGSVVIADEEKILALAGIKGSKFAEVDLNTKNIFIEAAIFDPQTIYKTSRNLNLITEASFRFERKVIPERSEQALERLSYLIQKFAKGEILKGKIKANRKRPIWAITFKEKKIKFNYERMKKYLGIDISKNEALNYLKNISPERIDINLEEDLYEEILRFYGIYKIRKKFEFSFHPAELDEILRFNYLIREILKELGYSEVYLYNFINEKDKEIFEELVSKPLEMLNPVSENYKYYSFSLLSNLLKAVSLNQRNFKEIKIFNISKIADHFERYSLGVVYVSNDRKGILKELKTCLNYLLKKLNINTCDFNEKTFKFSGLASEILINKEKIGIIGLFSKEISEIYDIDLDVGFIEIDLEKLKKFYKSYVEFVYWGDYPKSIRDISFLVDKKTKIPYILEIIEKEKIENLKNIEIIDIYFPDYDEGRKSVTLRFIFQNPKRTLTEKEVEREIEKIINILKQNFNAEIRG